MKTIECAHPPHHHTGHPQPACRHKAIVTRSETEI